MKLSARSTVLAGVVGLALAGLWSTDTGCSSSSNTNSDTGGAKATGGGNSSTGGDKATGGSGTGGGSSSTGGGSASTGGATSNTGGASNGTGGGSASTGGAGSGTGGSVACTMGTAPTDKLITDFNMSSVVGNVVSAGATGKIYPFPTTAGPTLSLSTGTNMAMTVKATVPVGDKYWGASLSFDKCIDASAYTGVQFTLSAVTLAGCELRFGVDFAEDVDPVANQNPKGTCTKTPCYGPATTITATTTKVAFADLNYGAPVAMVNPKTILGLAWTLHSPLAGDAGAGDCTNATFTVDDVTFY